MRSPPEPSSLNITPPVLRFDRVSKYYAQSGADHRLVLRETTFEIRPGRTVALVGRSGSGKTTLLNLASGIDVPSEGEVHLDGRALGKLSEHDRTLLRRRTVGMVFQFFHLLPHLSVEDNIALPEWINGMGSRRIAPRIRELLDRVDLADRAGDTIQKLSGGEMQRVAICRALLRRPRLLLADEPTGNLDDENAGLVMDLLLGLSREESTTLLFVTHSEEMARRADEIWHIHGGVVERP